MHTDHIGLHCFFHQIIDLHISSVIALKGSVGFPGTGNCFTGHIFYFCCFAAFFHCKISACKICETHAVFLPCILFSYNAGDTVSNSYPVFCNLIHISILIQFFRRIDPDHIAFFATVKKFQHSGYILPKIINISSIYRMYIFRRITANHFDSWLKLLHKFTGWSIFFCHNRCILPVRIIEFYPVPSWLFQ